MGRKNDDVSSKDQIIDDIDLEFWFGKEETFGYEESDWDNFQEWMESF